MPTATPPRPAACRAPAWCWGLPAATSAGCSGAVRQPLPQPPSGPAGPCPPRSAQHTKGKCGGGCGGGCGSTDLYEAAGAVGGRRGRVVRKHAAGRLWDGPPPVQQHVRCVRLAVCARSHSCRAVCTRRAASPPLHVGGTVVVWVIHELHRQRHVGGGHGVAGWGEACRQAWGVCGHGGHTLGARRRLCWVGAVHVVWRVCAAWPRQDWGWCGCVDGTCCIGKTGRHRTPHTPHTAAPHKGQRPVPHPPTPPTATAPCHAAAPPAAPSAKSLASTPPPDLNSGQRLEGLVTTRPCWPPPLLRTNTEGRDPPARRRHCPATRTLHGLPSAQRS